MTTKKEFFKIAATAVLLPIALVAGISIGAVFAVLFAVATYAALIFGALRWVLRIARTLLFGKAARRGEREVGPAHPSPTVGGGLPGDFDAAYEAEWKRREAAHWKWLQ
jgi:hypothetical protein